MIFLAIRLANQTTMGQTGKFSALAFKSVTNMKPLSQFRIGSSVVRATNKLSACFKPPAYSMHIF